MTKDEREISVWILAIGAVFSLLAVAPSLGWKGVTAWIIYFAVGGLFMRLGVYLIGVLAEDHDVKIGWTPAVIYLTWPLTVGLLLVVTLVVQFFRFALDFNSRI